MNTLLVALLSALRDHRWLRLLGCAFILSSVGNGLTQVVVYSQLLRWHVSPALTLIFKRGLKANELPAATALETLIFAAQVLLGVGLGVMIINRFSLITLLVMDAFSFIFSAILLMFTARHFIKRYVNESQQPAFAVALKWRECSPLQRRSMLLLPLLAAVGTPVMALMPALAQQIRPDETTGLALPLLLARSLGQVCGPLLLNSQKLRQHAQSNLRLVGYLSTFLAGYFLLPALATWNLAAGTAEIIGPINALYVVSLPGILGVVIVLKRSGR